MSIAVVRSSRALIAALALVAGCGPERLVPSGGTPSESEVAGAIIVNEVLANESGSDVAGEFVEIVHVGEGAVPLGGFALADGSGPRHVFAQDDTLAPGEALVVFGGAAAIPPHVARAEQASTGRLDLADEGDSLVLVDATGAEVDRVSYGASLAGVDGVSMNRSADGDARAAFVLHTSLVAAPSSPGTRADGGAFGEGEPPDAGPPVEPPPEPLRIRVVAANLTSGDRQSYDPGEGIRILQGLDPDVALVGEMNFGAGTGADIRSFVDQAFGPEFDFIRQDGVQIPSGVVSRFPIVRSGVVDDPTLEDRDVAFARIDLPGDRELWAFSLHLHSASSTNRTVAAEALVAFIRAEVNATDFMILGGDLNTQSRAETCIERLAEVVETDGPFPVDQDGADETNQPRSRPYDWVLADQDLERLAVATAIGGQSFASGLVFDSRVFTPLSEVPPVEAGDSGAAGMQHMAVVRDFEIAAAQEGGRSMRLTESHGRSILQRSP